jgi:uncharacterized protein YcbX
MHLTQLALYPVKSCRGISVQHARLTSRGFEGDRRFMLVDASGKFVTQREDPSMSQLHCELGPNGLTLSHSGLEPITVPERLHDGPRLDVQVWRDRCSAIIHEEGSRWCSQALGRELRLAYMPDEATRRAGAGPQLVSFADGYPYLLATESSLADLNARLDTPITMDRFRPNIVLDGDAPFAEDDWTELRIGEVRFTVTKPCDRCSVTTVDPISGKRGKEPLRTLATFRKWDDSVWFGVNLVANDPGELRVGDPVVLG